MLTSQQRHHILTVLLAFLSVLQGCQSQSSLNAADENTVSENSIALEVQQGDSGSTKILELALPLPSLPRAHSTTANQAPTQPLSPSNSASFSYGPLTASTGEQVYLQRSGNHWQAEVSGGLNCNAPQQILPVVASAGIDIASMLSWWQNENPGSLKAHVRVLPMHPALRGPCVCLDKADLVGEIKDSSSQDIAQPPAVFFGKQEWKKYFGVSVGKVPPLPKDINNILGAYCPCGFRLEGEHRVRKVGSNHLLVLIPATVDGKPFTLDKLGELAMSHFPNSESGYGYYNPDIQDAFGNQSLPEAPYWLLMTHKVLEDSLRMAYVDQQAMVNRYSDHGYRLPHGLEAATCILANYARSGKRGERLFGDNPWRYTRCAATQLVYIDRRRPLLVGGFGLRGLSISYIDCYGGGVACCRKL